MLVLFLAIAHGWKHVSFKDILHNMHFIEVADETQPVVDQVNDTLTNTEVLINSQAQELYFTSQAVNRSVTHVGNNEDARQACLITFNTGAISLNAVLSGMVTGAQLINNVIDVANSAKTMIATDIKRLNRDINVLDMWGPIMTNWANFVETQTTLLDAGQSQIVTWGEKTQSTINQQKVSIILLAREIFNLETDILTMQEQLNSVASVFNYSPMTITVAEAAQGTDGQTVYNPWS